MKDVCMSFPGDKWKRTWLLRVCLWLAGGLLSAPAWAQTMDVHGMLKSQERGADGKIKEDTIMAGIAYLFLDKEVGEKAYKKIVKHNTSSSGERFDYGGLGANSYYSIDGVTGVWSVDGVSRGNVIIVVPSGGGLPHKFVVEAGKKEYNYTYPPAGDSQRLEGVTVSASLRTRKKAIRPSAPWEDGDYITWEIFSLLDRDYLKKASRFMFVPKAYEYGSDKMVENIPPAVYDTRGYARTQERRKSFDYEVNDSLAAFLLAGRASRTADGEAVDSTLILNDSVFITKYRFNFRMPDRDKLYYYRGVRELEDYTHVYFSDTVRSSHLRKKPWRFLVTDFAVQYGELADSLYEPPKSEVRNEPRTLELEFVLGKAVLTDTPKNDSIKASVENDMRMYRNNLQQVKISGSASPEGSLERNRALADERASYAVGWLRSRYPGVNIEREPSTVYGWDAVAERLEARGKKELAADVRRMMAAGTTIGRGNLPEWEETVEPVLQELRTMSCSYLIRMNSPLSPMEAVDRFLHDPDYAEGGPKSFSRGDYFNIYKNLADTAALEKLTERIYRTEIKPFRRARYNNFYAYVANRYVADKLRHGTVDAQTPQILNGFVNIDTLRGGHHDSEESGISTRENGLYYRINRSPHVANLALVYFKLKKYSRADSLAQWLPDVEKYQAVRKLTLLCSRFLKYPEEAEPGLEYAWNASPLSRAVLAVELRTRLGEREMNREDLLNLLWSLPDSEPRKWYLLALVTMEDPVTQKYSNPKEEELARLRERLKKIEDDAEANGVAFNILMSSDEWQDLDTRISELESSAPKYELKDSLPDFMAYLQHAFDLDSNYYRLHYMTDYDFDEKINRGKQMKPKRDFRFNPKLAVHYRKRFDDIYRYMQKMAAAKQKEEEVSPVEDGERASAEIE